MSGNLWLCVRALASMCDASEEAVDDLQEQLTALAKSERDELRRKMILIVSELSRLETRMKEVDGAV